MTFDRFQQLWEQAGLPVPTHTDHSPELIDALVKAADNDFSAFEKIEKRLQA